jgi:hypothetical protein
MISSAGEFYKYLKLFAIPSGASGFSPFSSLWNTPGGGVSIGNRSSLSTGSAATVNYFGFSGGIGTTDLSALGGASTFTIYGGVPSDSSDLAKITATTSDLDAVIISGEAGGDSSRFIMWTAEDSGGNANAGGAYTLLPIVNYGSGPGRKKITTAGTTSLTSKDEWVNVTGSAIAITVNLPDENTILSGHEVEFSIQAAITSIALASPNSKTISTGTLPVAARSYFTVRYDSADSTWYRIR